MKYLCLIIILGSTVKCELKAQTDSTFSVVRSGVEAKFQFRRFDKLEQLRNVSGVSFPIYSFNKTQYTRIKGLLINFTQLESDYKKLLANRDARDSVREVKEKALSDGFGLQEQRAKNFEASYNSLLSINAKLNEQVKSAEQLAIREHKRRKLNSILVGTLAFTTGALIGVAIR